MMQTACTWAGVALFTGAGLAGLAFGVGHLRWLGRRYLVMYRERNALRREVSELRDALDAKGEK